MYGEIPSMPETDCIGCPFKTAITVATPIQGLLTETHGIGTVAIKHQIVDYRDTMTLASISAQ